MKLYIVRHGETNYNVAGLYNAYPDDNVVLTQKGIADAKNVAEQLEGVEFDCVFVSELKRTQQTAKLVRSQSEFVIDERLNDIHNGYEGKPVAEYHQLRKAAPNSFTFRVADEFESSADVYERIEHFLADLRRQPYQNVLIVTSANCVGQFLSLLDHLDPQSYINRPSISNGEILVRKLNQNTDVLQ